MGSGQQQMDADFMKDITYEDCNLFGLSSLLAVNYNNINNNQQQDISNASESALKGFDEEVAQVLGGGAARAQRKANRAQKHQVGNTFGNYDLIKEENNYVGYKQDERVNG